MAMEEKKMEEYILEAAEELFLEQGFAKTTTGQIAKLAGCNQALVHYYYRTKDNLFEKIFEEKARFLFTNILNTGNIEGTFEEKIRITAGAHFDFLIQNPRLVPFVLSEIMSNPERLRSLVVKVRQYPQSIFEQMEPLLNAEIEKGNIRPITTIDLLLTIVSLNIAPFFILPAVQKAMDFPDAALNVSLEQRKQEAIETVLARLKK
jgi:AcrR family transcriptional regulator